MARRRRDGGIVKASDIGINNPSVSPTADSSPCTGEPTAYQATAQEIRPDAGRAEAEGTDRKQLAFFIMKHSYR